MKGIALAISVAGLIFGAVSGTSQAAPIAPLLAGTHTETGYVTEVYDPHYRYHGPYNYYRPYYDRPYYYYRPYYYRSFLCWNWSSCY